MVKKDSEAKEDLKSFKEEIIHQFHIISENVIDQVKQVAEGVITVDQKLDRFREEIKGEVEEGYGILSNAITGVNEKLEATRQELKTEIQGVRQELIETRQELKTEIGDTRKEILAATKLSYAELDRRLVTLEKEFIELKQRVEKIESRHIT